MGKKMGREKNRQAEAVENVETTEQEQLEIEGVETAGETVEQPVVEAKPKKERAPRTKKTPEERKAKQNAYYAQWRAKLAEDPEKLAAYRKMKNDASKRFHAKHKVEKVETPAEAPAAE